MKLFRTKNGPSIRAVGRRTARPLVEGLEDRFLLYAASGGQWTYPIRITYSLVPDGTSVGGVASNLYSTMNQYASTATWTAAIQKAAAIWETVANIQLVQVSDNGAAVGTSGDQQGDTRFGDIRIGAVPEQTGTLGLAFLPPTVNGGTVAGDLFFNSNVNWNSNSGFDLETVAIHELGHALGMSHSSVQAADMYASYNGVKQSFNTDDVNGIDSIYGAVAANTTNNGTVSTAIDLTHQVNANNQIVLGGQEIVSASDQEFYKVTVPQSTSGTMTVSIQATSLSSLAPRLTLYNSSGQGFAQAVNTNGFGTTATLVVSNVTAGQIYYLRATAANTGAGDVGDFGVLVNFGTKPQATVAPPNTVVASTSSSGVSGSSNAETTGNGGGLLTNLLGGLVNGVATVVGDIIQIGNLTGYGDAMHANAAYLRHHHLGPALNTTRHRLLAGHRHHPVPPKLPGHPPAPAHPIHPQARPHHR